MKKVVTFGEILLRLSPPGYLRFSQVNSLDVQFGGGEANTAVSLANYGVNVDFITRIPDNDIAQCALMEMRKRGVGTSNVIYGGDRLGIYFLENGAVSRGSKVVYDRENSAMSQIKSGMTDWDFVLKDATWFHWCGITPAISQSAAEACLEAVKAASAKGLTISTDFNYRAKLWKYCNHETRQKIMTELTSYSTIILGSEYDAKMFFNILPDEVSTTLNTSEKKREEFLSICKKIQEQFPTIKKIIKTERGSISASHNTWGGILFDGAKLYESPKYEITDIVDRVGGGDSFMGALIYVLLENMNDNQRALNFATAASCLKHTIKGDVNLMTVEEVEKLMEGDASGRVSR
ncbi:sugar kinase [uncultured Tenacibaculum sp.]|uniref:sugar kinase n=1 Tax=uncultured Tenacibaculum sp. TaxID=174713 RepID=UPI00261DFFC8|nr:sugar kinase [uncultured Tenacibaculum sp.]